MPHLGGIAVNPYKPTAYVSKIGLLAPDQERKSEGNIRVYTPSDGARPGHGPGQASVGPELATGRGQCGRVRCEGSRLRLSYWPKNDHVLR